MNWLKKRIRGWLEGPYTNGAAVEELLDDAETAVRRVADMELRLKDMHQLLGQEQEKFNALCDALGVVIVGNIMVDPPEQMIVSIHPDGVLGKHNENFVHAIDAQRRALINDLGSFTSLMSRIK